MKMLKIISGITMIIGILSLSSCEEEYDPPSNSSNLFTRFTLQGQTWVFTQYFTADMNFPTMANDTLVFSDTTHYTWNGVPSTYQYYYFDGAYNTKLQFDNSPFGGITAPVPDHFETYGQLNGAKFIHGYSSQNIYYYMWFKKI